MSSTSLFLLFVGVSVAAVSIWMLLDWLPRFRDRPFRPRGEAIPKRRSRRRAWREVRAVTEEEEVRETLSASFGTPTLRRSYGRESTDDATGELDFDYIEALRSDPLEEPSSNGHSSEPESDPAELVNESDDAEA